MRSIQFYFDFISPYAYLAHHRLVDLTRRLGWALDHRPIDLAGAKRSIGNTGPGNREMPVKHRYLRTDLRRWAERYGVPFEPPAGYGSERLNCGAFFALDRGLGEAYVRVAWQRIWGEGRAMNDDALLGEVAEALGWNADEFLRYTASDAATRRLRESTQAATQRGVFGVPIMAIGDELWWGNDRLDFVEAHMTRLTNDLTENT